MARDHRLSLHTGNSDTKWLSVTDDIDDNRATNDTIENRFSILMIIFIIISIITSAQQAVVFYLELMDK